MPPGKLAAQAGHAYVNAILAASPPIRDTYQAGDIGTKVCLAAKSHSHILKILDTLQSSAIPTQIIIDSGHVLLPHFTGKPTLTALGFGPLTKDQLPTIINKLELL